MKREVTHFCGLILSLTGILTLSGPSAFAQGTAAVARNTPQAVVTGSATLTGHFNPNQMLRLVVGIKPPHLQEEEQFLQNLQDRNSPEFHAFLTPEQWNERFAPSAQDEQAVVSWLQNQGFTISSRWPNRLTVDAEGTTATAEKAFGVTINSYQMDARSFFSNDRDPVVPASLADIIESVAGLENLHQWRPRISGRNSISTAPIYSAGSLVSKGEVLTHDGNVSVYSKKAKAGVKPQTSNGGLYDPSDLWSSYGYNYNALYKQGHCCNPLGNPTHSPKETSIAVVGAGVFVASDFLAFANTYGLAGYVQPIYIGGSPTSSDANVETALDIEWSTAMSNSFGSSANTAAIFFYNTANENPGTFSTAFQQILNDNQTRVINVSYGAAEEYSSFGAPSVANTDHAIFNNLTGAGWSIVVSSGDSGATGSCVAARVVDYPGSDPDVVSAGGTTLYDGTAFGSTSEIGWIGGTAAGSCSRNDGGSTGGCSQYFAAPSYQNHPACGSGSRSVPDISLNANYGQNVYTGGGWGGYGGTSIVSPELAGFFAQENAYLLYLSTIVGSTGCWEGGSCYPIGNPNYAIYYTSAKNYPNPQHYPFYDITSGCNSNDITAEYGTGYYCAGAGYDLVTGWGSANMFQFAWAINYYITADYGAPAISFSGPATGRWYNRNQTVSWSIRDTSGNTHPATGVAGFSAAWDGIYADAYTEATGGAGNSFYYGPYYPNQSSGSLNLSAVSQGCHTVYIQAWDNTGWTDGQHTYGTLCYDVTAPITTASLNGTYAGSEYDGPVQVTLNRSDNASGVAATYYQLDGGGSTYYSGPFTASGVGSHTVYFYSVDVAGNVENQKSVSFTIRTAGSGALYFVPVAPCRVADTRNPSGPFGGPELAAASTRNFTVPSSTCSIPSNAASYSLNITVVPTAQLGYLTVWPAGQTQPGVSTLNSDGRVKANAAIVPAGSAGAISVYASDATQVIIDIDGYFVEAGSAKSGLAFYKVAPCRLVDTRQAASSLGGPFLSGNSSRQFPLLSGSCGIPSSAAAYSLNYTALPHGGLGYLTTWPSGQAQPVVSTLNAPTGTTTANAAIVPAGTGGNVSVFVSNDSDLLIDINGYFAAPSSRGLSLYPLTPCRALDTRNSSGEFTGALAVNIAGSNCNVPASAQAYILNATVVPPDALTYLTLWPNGQPQPGVSTLNAFDGAITSNMAIVPTTNGLIDAYASDPTQLILDISSYFAP